MEASLRSTVELLLREWHKIANAVMKLVTGFKVSSINDIWIRDTDHANLVNVTLTLVGMGRNHTTEYKAYAVRGMTLEEYLADREETTKAAILAKGRFAFPDQGMDENILPAAISGYAYQVATAIEKKKYTELHQSGGEARKQDIRKHYEGIRKSFDEILQGDPKITDYKIAQRLNELGLKTVNSKPWQVPSVQGLRLYLQNDPAYAYRGKLR